MPETYRRYEFPELDSVARGVAEVVVTVAKICVGHVTNKCPDPVVYVLREVVNILSERR